MRITTSKGIKKKKKRTEQKQMCFIFVLILFGYLNLHMYKNDLPNSDTDKFTEINHMAH